MKYRNELCLIGFMWLIFLGGCAQETNTMSSDDFALLMKMQDATTMEEILEYWDDTLEFYENEFGWQFGNWQLQGVKGIENDLRKKLPSKKVKDEGVSYPTPGYPPPMTKGAILYGGTDPGWFVPSYMIYSAKMRPDLHVLTQNALADYAYLSRLYNVYGDRIAIPSSEECNAVLEQYSEDVKSGRISADTGIIIGNDGQISIEGATGVMQINGVLAKVIFEKNKALHDFYVEEGYAIQWMYPYLTPHGLIMKINKEPLAAIPPDVVENDHKFWEWYTKRLLDDSKFRENEFAKKTFSKLRGAIGGLYEWRNMFDEAEYAYQQSIDLYRISPEANMRMAQLYIRQKRYQEAERLIGELTWVDPTFAAFYDNVRNIIQMDVRRTELENLHRSNQMGLTEAFELLFICRQMRDTRMAQQIASNLLKEPNLPPEALMTLAQIFASDQRLDLFADTLQRYLQHDTENMEAWLDLGASRAMQGQEDAAIECVQRAMDIDSDKARLLILQDPRFQSLRGNSGLQALLKPHS